MRKITIDNGFKYVSNFGSYSPPETSTKPKTASFPQKQHKNLPHTNKKIYKI